MTESRKLLVIGIDAASPELLKAWAADGTLPNIAGMMATGLIADTCSVPGLYVGATWPSFYTGLDPSHHGIYWLEQLKMGTYRTGLVTADDVGRHKAIWEVLSDAGRRVLVLDVPLARRSPALNGAQVVEWRTHDVLFGFQTTPATLKDTVLELVGDHPAPAPCDTARRSLQQYQEFADQLVRGARARGQLTCRLLQDSGWDFAIQVFSEAHCAGHQLWHFHDASHPGFDPVATRESGDLLRRVYAAIDAALGEVLAQVEPDTTVVLLTLHGMSHTAGASRILGDILMRLGVSSPPSWDPPAGPQTLSARVRHGLRRAYHRIPFRVRRPLFELRARFNRTLLRQSPPIAIDPHRSRCFAVDTGPLFGGIRLNLIGREPAGTLARGPDADAFIGELSGWLLELIRPDTGQPLIRQVLRTADLFDGPCLDTLPDLLVEWDLAQPLGTAVAGSGAGALLCAESPRMGRVELVNQYCRTGEHRVNGMLIARGPGIAAGTLGRVVPNLDLAATFAQLLDCNMPGVNGKPVPELTRR